MPASATHYILAKEVQNSLDDSLKESVNKTAYYFGAQGPDFLFMHRALPYMSGESIREYGDKIHGALPSKTLNAIRDFVNQEENPVYRSYALGFMCHYALDSTAHPYINAITEELLEDEVTETRETVHGEIESSLDSIMIRSKSNKLPTDVKFKKFFPKDEVIQRAVSKLYSYIIKELFNEEVSKEQIYQATNDARALMSFLTDRTTIKQRFFDRLERGKPHMITSHIVPITENPEFDYANTSQTEWGSESRTDSFFELYDESVVLAKSLIENFDSCDFAEITGEKLFCG